MQALRAPTRAAAGCYRRGRGTRPYTRRSGAHADRPPLRGMSGLLRRLTRRRPATADENRPLTAESSEPVSAPAETPAEAGGQAPVPGDQPTQVLPETGDQPAGM